MGLRDKTGHVYGKLEVLGLDGYHYFPSGSKRAKWLCRCECGNTTSVLASSLNPKGVKSCNKCCKSGTNETTIEYLQRVYKECISNPSNKCFEWELSKCVNQGYGFVTINSISHHASRVIASWYCKKELSDSSWDGCHSCGNRLCINPLHIYAGTRSNNIEDQSKHGRHNSAKLSEQQVKDMRSGYANNLWSTYQQVADFYGVNVSVAHKIINRKHYKWIL